MRLFLLYIFTTLALLTTPARTETIQHVVYGHTGGISQVMIKNEPEGLLDGLLVVSH